VIWATAREETTAGILAKGAGRYGPWGRPSVRRGSYSSLIRDFHNIFIDEVKVSKPL